MRIAFATSECVPFVKTGGLADVSGALPRALAEAGMEVKVFLPLYDSIRVLDHGLLFAGELRDLPLQIGNLNLTCNTWYKKTPGLSLEHYFIDCPHYFHRGRVYTSDYDEDGRFILLQQALISILQRYHWAPQVLHANDWPTALLPVYLKDKYYWDRLFDHTASVLSIHNLGYQGRFGRESIAAAGLSYDKYYPGGPYEFHNSFSFLKTGILYADLITTVSETYAREIQTPTSGEGLQDILAMRRADLHGILNGIDTSEWNPRVDKYIPHRYDFDSFATKVRNKQALLARFGLPFDPEVPVIGMISRLTPQKGLELLAGAFHDLMQMPLQIIVLGEGERKYEEFLQWAVSAHPGKVGVYLGFNNELAHWITAGCDMFLMPSRYEPCGLNQMYSLNYGTVPIVRRTGGLADTVHDYHEFHGQGNGFSFRDFTPYALFTSVQRAVRLFHEKAIWREMVRRGMSEDFSWQHAAQKYLEVYRLAAARKQ
ncbi:MAG: glycogen synthase GlgA [candidate division KSB1 bacterium]|nr:glycogen synthase GlgA [candidate division KSB1 bacterium]MDZ7273132.1 glycogen synthase GlgA [candidate division KSB1 bacterium]MDZ7285234.1 glycogen synthase GlgA [candidate division KSB1 bacterium]MDZ7298266.1 glycogen synthase GlgA [candidate division KSB1 bacterium]MDZ7308987.1 glycogen synthase GlgA [candidate division KSB1 bacterium]